MGNTQAMTESKIIDISRFRDNQEKGMQSQTFSAGTSTQTNTSNQTSQNQSSSSVSSLFDIIQMGSGTLAQVITSFLSVMESLLTLATEIQGARTKVADSYSKALEENADENYKADMNTAKTSMMQGVMEGVNGVLMVGMGGYGLWADRGGNQQAGNLENNINSEQTIRDRFVNGRAEDIAIGMNDDDIEMDRVGDANNQGNSDNTSTIQKLLEGRYKDIDLSEDVGGASANIRGDDEVGRANFENIRKELNERIEGEQEELNSVRTKISNRSQTRQFLQQMATHVVNSGCQFKIYSLQADAGENRKKGTLAAAEQQIMTQLLSDMQSTIATLLQSPQQTMQVITSTGQVQGR
jgi:hypothetical protein